jgi:hypothetical protein
MFSRKSCYFFVRPKTKFLEVCVFLGRPIKAPQIRRIVPSSRTKLAHFFQIKHRDEVESPLTDWLQEAYEFSAAAPQAARAATKRGRHVRKSPTRKTRAKASRRKSARGR